MKREELIAPQMYNIVSEFERYADGSNREALIYVGENREEQRVTYDELLLNANRVANVFIDHGLQKGDTILVMVPRTVMAYITYIAALKVGLVVIPSSEMLRPSDIEYRIAHSQAKGIVIYEAFQSLLDDVTNNNMVTQFTIGRSKKDVVSLTEQMRDASQQFNGTPTSKEDHAFLSYTSGTTGKPKGAIHTHAWGYAHLRTAATQWLGIKEGDIVWATAAPGWQKWIWSPFVSVLGSGATALVYNGKFDVNVYFDLIDQYEVDILCCTPTEYRFMAKADHLKQANFSSIRHAVSAGEPLNREVIEVFQQHFDLTVRDGYGQTENTLLVGTMVGMEPRPGSMGKPTPGNIVEIIDENGNILPPGEVGDIAVHSSTPALFKAYFNEPERTKQQFRGDYYITGDRAKKDEDGYFWFEGRRDDMIISSGYTIGPFEVEDALTKHEAVRECAVVASPDEVRGSVVKAYIVLRDSSRANEVGLIEELQEHVKQLTAPYKYPRKIEFVEELPKTASGKIMRVQLRKQEEKYCKKNK